MRGITAEKKSCSKGKDAIYMYVFYNQENSQTLISFFVDDLQVKLNQLTFTFNHGHSKTSRMMRIIEVGFMMNMRMK